jgi:hypothetical protein
MRYFIMMEMWKINRDNGGCRCQNAAEMQLHSTCSSAETLRPPTEPQRCIVNKGILQKQRTQRTYAFHGNYF